MTDQVNYCPVCGTAKTTMAQCSNTKCWTHGGDDMSELERVYRGSPKPEPVLDITTMNPRFDPRLPVRINGYRYVREDQEPASLSPPPPVITNAMALEMLKRFIREQHLDQWATKTHRGDREP